MSYLKKLPQILIVFAAMFALSACDGEAEEAGEELDQIATDAKNAVEDACEKVKEGVKAEDQDC